jgi:hypothetical protein
MFSENEPPASIDDLLRDSTALSIHQLVVMEDEHPLEMILKLLLSQGEGGQYDVLSVGLGLAEDLINIAEIEKYRDLPAFADLRATMVLGYDGAAIKFYDVVQSILSALWGVLVVAGDGRLTARFAGLDPHVLAAPEFTIDKNRMVSGSGDGKPDSRPQISFDHRLWATGVKATVNRYSDGQGVQINLSDPDAAAFFSERLIPLDCGSLNFSSALANYLESRLDAVMSRLGKPPPLLRFEGRMREESLLAGDQITVDLSGLPGMVNPQTGQKRYDTPVWAEIFERELEPSSGRAAIAAEIIGLDDLHRKGVIAPSALIEDYDSQTLTLTVAQSVFSSADNPYGATDSAHFQDGDKVRIWDPSGAIWKGSATVDGEPSSTAVVLKDLNCTPEPAAGDILEYAEWPETRTSNEQFYCVHLADDGETANKPEDDELLPVSYGPSVYSDAPFTMSAESR